MAASQWIPQYKREWLRADLVAGLTLAAYLLPAGIGDASLAGLPPQAGLYACLFGGLVFWLFCSSKHTGHHRHLRVVAAHRRVGRRIERRRSGASCGAGRCVALMVGGARGRGVAGPRGQRGGVFFRNGAGRVQSRPRLLSREHATAQAVRLQGLARRFLGARARIFCGISARPTSRRWWSASRALACLIAGKLWVKNRPVAFFVVRRRHPGRQGLRTSRLTGWRCSAKFRRAFPHWDCRTSAGTT